MREQIDTQIFTTQCLDDIARWLTSAELELAAYRLAVLEKHGDCAADWATTDWINSLETMAWPPSPPSSCWRQLTFASTFRLASWLELGMASSPTSDFQTVDQPGISFA
jgi:hypothetical protein